MTDESLPPFASLARYLAGEATSADRTAVDHWLAADSAHQALLDQLHQVWTTSAADAPGVHDLRVQLTDPAVMADRVSRAIQRSETLHPIPKGKRAPLRSPARTNPAWRMLQGAALVAAVIGVVGLIRMRLDRPGASSARTYTTTTGQRATVTLTDGSRVTLAPQTTLTVTAGFGGRHRVVSLSGEAAFRVAPESGAPFIVRTGTVDTRVLGTSFDVHHYAADRNVRVAVTQGKVAVSSSAHGRIATVTAGMFALATDSTISTAVMDDATPYTGWTTNRLKFANAPLPDVLATVGRWYGYTFQLADTSLANDHVTATFDYASTTDMIKALEALLAVSATFETRGTDTVVMLRRRTRVSTPDGSRHVFPNTFSPRTEVGR